MVEISVSLAADLKCVNITKEVQYFTVCLLHGKPLVSQLYQLEVPYTFDYRLALIVRISLSITKQVEYLKTIYYFQEISN